MLSTIDEFELSESNYKSMIEDKDIQIKFLEDERRLFQDMADELRAGVSSLGGSMSSTILTQVVDKVNEKRVGLNFISDDSENEEDDEYNSETILEEFEVLADEIQKNGGVFVDRSSTLPRGVVYDRLTNPSNFTGSMKNVFEKDLQKKREKVQHSKQQAAKPNGNKSVAARRKSKDESKYNQMVDYLMIMDENSGPQSEEIDTDTIQTGQSDTDTIQTIKSIEIDMDDNRDSPEVNVFDRLYSKQIESKIANDQQSTNKESKLAKTYPISTKPDKAIIKK